MPDYERGDTARLNLTVNNDAGIATNPATLTLTVRSPAGVATTYTSPAPQIVQTAPGTYYADIALTETGTWAYQWQTTAPGNVQGGRLTVRAAPIDQIPSSLSLDELKRRLGRELDVDDDTLKAYLDAAFAQAQAPYPFGCGRLLEPDPADPAATTTRTVRVTHGRALVKDASSLSTVTVAGSAVTGYRTLTKDGYIVQISGLPNTATEAVLTGRFGFSAIPANLADAIYVLAARMRYEEAAMYADNVAVLEGDAASVYYRQLPVRTKLVFATYMVAPAIVGLA